MLNEPIDTSRAAMELWLPHTGGHTRKMVRALLDERDELVEDAQGQDDRIVQLIERAEAAEKERDAQDKFAIGNFRRWQAAEKMLADIRERMVRGGASWVATLNDFDQAVAELREGREFTPQEWKERQRGVVPDFLARYNASRTTESEANGRDCICLGLPEPIARNCPAHSACAHCEHPMEEHEAIAYPPEPDRDSPCALCGCVRWIDPTESEEVVSDAKGRVWGHCEVCHGPLDRDDPAYRSHENCTTESEASVTICSCNLFTRDHVLGPYCVSAPVTGAAPVEAAWDEALQPFIASAEASSKPARFDKPITAGTAPVEASAGVACSKCGSSDIITRHRPVTEPRWEGDDKANPVEHLTRHCRNCQFDWTSVPLAQQASADVATDPSHQWQGGFCKMCGERIDGVNAYVPCPNSPATGRYDQYGVFRGKPMEQGKRAGHYDEIAFQIRAAASALRQRHGVVGLENILDRAASALREAQKRCQHDSDNDGNCHIHRNCRTGELRAHT